MKMRIRSACLRAPTAPSRIRRNVFCLAAALSTAAALPVFADQGELERRTAELGETKDNLTEIAREFERTRDRKDSVEDAACGGRSLMWSLAWPWMLLALPLPLTGAATEVAEILKEDFSRHPWAGMGQATG